MNKTCKQGHLHFSTDSNLSEADILDWAQRIIESRFKRCNYLTSPEIVREYLRAQLATEEREVFCIIMLDSKHGVLHFEPLFYGTIDGANVYPREVIKTVLNTNAAAVILAHNHPSGDPEPSQSDIALTKRIQTALLTVDVRLLDHLIIGGAVAVSFAERGLL